MTDDNLMLKAMDDRHVDMCTLTQTNPHILWAPPAFGVKLAQTINDASSELCMKYGHGYLRCPLTQIITTVREIASDSKSYW
jgi:hypothetical protein